MNGCQHPRSIDVGLLLLRLIAGAVFLFHGSQKLFGAFEGHGIEGFAGMLAQMQIPMPLFAAYLSACTEFFGGLALLLGLGVRFASVPLVINMLVAAFTVHAGKFDATKGGMEYPLTLAFLVAALAFTGPGQFSVAALFPQRPRPEASGRVAHA
jgi:putative oxidoreductase